MRTTMDIPDPLYGKLKAKAALDGTSVKDIVVRLVRQEVEPPKRGTRVRLPLIRARETRKLDITNAEINEILLS